MASLAIVTVKRFNSLDVNQQEIISFDHVSHYFEAASGADTQVAYNPSGDSVPSQIVLDDTYASFNTAYQGRTSTAGVPFYVISEAGRPVNRTTVISSDDVVRVIPRADGVTCDLVYFDQRFSMRSAHVKGTLAGIFASQYSPSAAISTELYRTNDAGVPVTVAAGTNTITFPSDFGTTDYDIYFTDLTGVGLDTGTIVKRTDGFDIDALGGGDITYVAIKNN